MDGTGAVWSCTVLMLALLWTVSAKDSFPLKHRSCYSWPCPPHLGSSPQRRFNKLWLDKLWALKRKKFVRTKCKIFFVCLFCLKRKKNRIICLSSEIGQCELRPVLDFLTLSWVLPVQCCATTVPHCHTEAQDAFSCGSIGLQAANRLQSWERRAVVGPSSPGFKCPQSVLPQSL